MCGEEHEDGGAERNAVEKQGADRDQRCGDCLSP